MYGLWDCMGWSPALQAGNSGGFNSHTVHETEYSRVAQSVEQTAVNRKVGGSSPLPGA